MKPIVVLTVLVVAGSGAAFSQTRTNPYHQYSSLSPASPGALRYGLAGFGNPAMLQTVRHPELQFTWTESWDVFPASIPQAEPMVPVPVRSWGTGGEVRQWGLFASLPGVGFGAFRQSIGDLSVTDYRFSLSGGDRTLAFGLGYGWSSGDTRSFERSGVVTAGTLVRPGPHFSLGLFGTIPTRGDIWEAVMDFGMRPFGDEVLTLFADFAVQHRQSAIRDGAWSVGGVLEPLPGIRLVGRYFDTEALSIGFQFSLGYGGVGAQTNIDARGKRAFNAYSVRIGAYDRNVFRSTVGARRTYLSLDLGGPISYQTFALFDNSKKFADLLSAIDAAKEDPAIAGIAVNTSALQSDREKLWELRERLKDFRSAGKRVIVFVDRPGMDTYHFASVADRIVMDPVGMLSLEGYVLGRTFFKGTLEKLGIGYDEWRFFRYKSAMESLARENMSEADREQRQRLVDEFYRIARADIIEGRGMSAGQFDALVDSTVLFLAGDALRLGLVDTLARWEGVKEVIARIEGGGRPYTTAGMLERYQLPYDDRWGEPPKIAVIYALGACAMDEGITARKLVKDVDAAVNDRTVKGIVLRVDSPGGDAMASDYIAEALKKAKGKKPVIVSQGAVAGSGGYWLSMYADTIVAAPMTITGSIGVIGGWVYDNGLKEKLGLTTDHVKAGSHADLGFGFTLPLIGGLPDRNMTPDERARAEYAIRSMYTEFVEKVASGRGKSPGEIEPVAQGRVWSGADGKERGLVDLLGGLTTAIDVARERAGIARSEPVTIVEYPKKGLIDFTAFMPKLIGVEEPGEKNDVVEMVRLRLKHNGRPMPVMSLEDLDLTLRP